MASKITPEIAKKMKERYEVLGTYAAVAKEFDVSASTASRYIKELNSIKTYDKFVCPPDVVITDEPGNILTFSVLTDEEAASYNVFMKEFGL